MALGLFLSAFAATEFQAVQFMPAFVLPQFLLCGLFVPRDEMADALEVVSTLLPLTYAYDALALAAADDLGRRPRARRGRGRAAASCSRSSSARRRSAPDALATIRPAAPGGRSAGRAISPPPSGPAVRFAADMAA